MFGTVANVRNYVGGRSTVARKLAARSAASGKASARDSFSRSECGGIPCGIKSFMKTMRESKPVCLNDTGRDFDLKDLPSCAKQSMKLLRENCAIFDDALKNELDEVGIPENIRFEYDYDANSRKAVITDISDEKYRDDVQAVMDKASGKYQLAFNFISGGSQILNGKMTKVYYPIVSKALTRCFGQDISSLYIDNGNNIAGANERLASALKNEKCNENFDAKEYYGFPTKKLDSVIRQLITDKSADENIVHMVYNEGSNSTADEIRLGKNTSDPQPDDGDMIIKAAAAGHWWLLDVWENTL